MKIDADSWSALSKLLDEWLDLPEESRAAWLESLGPEHADVLPVLRQMMLNQAGLEAKNFLYTLPKVGPAADSTAAGNPPLRAGAAAGELLGRYRLVRELGQGGMGVVWLAERADGEIKRPVALKLPIVLAYNPSVAERFARERDILAQLTHPSIARLYDAGVSDQGQPYLALEYVEGEKITVYCDQRRLDLRARLKLLLQVLRAVQYAHTNLIVHRDLKPANILVTNEGDARLLDFGIAKLLTEGEANETELTRIGGRALTPAYASPEQITGAAITTASDVYSLGVVFYELLTGERPYKLKRDTRRGLEDAILGAEPARPSQAAGGETKAQARGVTRRRLARSLKGDLDTIALKALSKQPSQRYASADAFAQDIERYLSGEAVLAQPESAWYRARKFVLRNKLAVGAASAVLLALGAGLAVALWQANRASLARQEAFRERDRTLRADTAVIAERNRAVESQVRAEQERNTALAEKQRAETEAATSKALNDFLQNGLLAQASARTQAGPNRRPDPDLKVRDALDRAASKLAGRFDSQPAVEASIRQTIGLTYRDLGLFAEARQQMERALELRRRVLGPEHIDTLSSMSELALVYISEGKYAPAEALLTDALGVQRRLLGRDHRDTLATMNDLAMVVSQRGDYARAATLLAGFLEAERRTLGAEHPDTLVVTNNLATQYVNQGKYAQAEDLYKRVVEIKRRVLGTEHPSTLAGMNNLAIVYRDEGKYSQAETLLTEGLDIRRRVLGERHPDTLDSMSSLGLLYKAEALYAESEPLLTQVLDARRRVLGEEHSFTLASINNLAELYRRRGKREEAESLFKQLLDARRRVLGPDHPNTTNVLASLGGIKLEQDSYAEAEPLLRQALSGYEKTSPDTWRRYYTQSMLGRSLAGLGKYADAEPLLISGYEGLMRRRSSIPSENRSILDEAREWIVQLYRVLGRPLLHRQRQN